MPRYFFDIFQDEKITPDEEGREFPDLDGARREALRLLAEMAKELVIDAHDERRKIAVRVRDQDGEVLTAAAVFGVKTRSNGGGH